MYHECSVYVYSRGISIVVSKEIILVTFDLEKKEIKQMSRKRVFFLTSDKHKSTVTVGPEMPKDLE